jgi:hypothetical protein
MEKRINVDSQHQRADVLMSSTLLISEDTTEEDNHLSKYMNLCKMNPCSTQSIQQELILKL